LNQCVQYYFKENYYAVYITSEDHVLIIGIVVSYVGGVDNFNLRNPGLEKNVRAGKSLFSKLCV